MQPLAGPPSRPSTAHFTSKPLLATDNAELHFYANLPPELSAGYAQPDARYPVTVRISNAANRPGSDSDPDMRGIALRVRVSETERHDLLATNYPVSHARNARQFVNFAVATAGGTVSRVFGIGGLLFSEGPAETVRMLKNVKEARRKIDSVALETYWSRGAMRWGPTLAVRFLIRPLNAAPVAGNFTGADSLSQEIATATRQRAGPVRARDPTLCRRPPHADRGHLDRMGARRRTDRADRDADNSAAERRNPHGRAGIPNDRRACVQPVEHDRRIPPARQSQPRPQGRLRRERGAPPADALARRAAAAQPDCQQRRSRALHADQPPLRMAPAAAASQPAQPRRLPRRCCGAKT